MKVTKIKLPRLRRSRETRKLSRTALAKRALTTVHQVYWAEHGRAVKQATANGLARALGIKVQSLRS